MPKRSYILTHFPVSHFPIGIEKRIKLAGTDLNHSGVQKRSFKSKILPAKKQFEP